MIYKAVFRGGEFEVRSAKWWVFAAEVGITSVYRSEATHRLFRG